MVGDRDELRCARQGDLVAAAHQRDLDAAVGDRRDLAVDAPGPRQLQPHVRDRRGHVLRHDAEPGRRGGDAVAAGGHAEHGPATARRRRAPAARRRCRAGRGRRRRTAPDAPDASTSTPAMSGVFAGSLNTTLSKRAPSRHVNVCASECGDFHGHARSVMVVGLPMSPSGTYRPRRIAPVGAEVVLAATLNPPLDSRRHRWGRRAWPTTRPEITQPAVSVTSAWTVEPGMTSTTTRLTIPANFACVASIAKPIRRQHARARTVHAGRTARGRSRARGGRRRRARAASRCRSGGRCGRRRDPR